MAAIVATGMVREGVCRPLCRQDEPRNDTMPHRPTRLTRLDEAQLHAASGGTARVGTDNGDTLNGSAASDTIYGADGNDTVSGAEGSDQLRGMIGDDLLIGGAGSDRLDGGTGNDTIVGGAGADNLSGDSNDVLPDQTIVVAAGEDVFLWAPGDGNDTISGGNGTDTLVVNVPGMTLDQLLAGLTWDPRGPTPAIVDGAIDLTGIVGTLTIGGETIRFLGLERLQIGS
jgi:Ca2+-binding RTX toxin-like protein